MVFDDRFSKKFSLYRFYYSGCEALRVQHYGTR